MKVVAMSERRVRLFRNGRNQAVRIPRDMEFEGTEAIMRREGNRLILEAAPAVSLMAVLAALSPLDQSVPAIADPAPEPVNL